MVLRRKSREPERRDPPADLLAVGLGNPGDDYESTRHNVGFGVVDVLAARHGASWRASRHRALVSEYVSPTGIVALGKPQTYMNLSGESVNGLRKWYDVPELGSLLVVHDELDLPLGTLRIKQGGGTAGHRGLDSIVRTCGGKDFVRLRFGIGRPPGRMPATDFVLKRFRRDEVDDVAIALEQGADMVEHWMAHGVEDTQNRFHGN